MRSNEESRAERVGRWCALGSFAVEARPGDRLGVGLDEQVDLEVEIDLGHGDEPLRVRDRFDVPAADLPGLAPEVVESVVLGRSSMIDGRIAGPGTVETVVAVYPEGLDRHTFMTALFEIQKVRALVREAVATRAADAVTIAELERLVGEPGPR